MGTVKASEGYTQAQVQSIASSIAGTSLADIKVRLADIDGRCLGTCEARLTADVSLPKVMVGASK